MDGSVNLGIGKKVYELRLLTVLKRNIIWMLIVGLISATGLFAYSSQNITTNYSASVMLYINNSSLSVSGGTISVSAGSINTSRSLVSTLAVVLQNSTVYDEVIARTGVYYTYGQLQGMVSASAEDSTEIMRITVTSNNPDTSILLANTIAEVFPIKIAEIIDNCSARLISEARYATGSNSNNMEKIVIGGSLAVMAAFYAIMLFADAFNGTIHSTEYILDTYDIPLLGEVPDLTSKRKGSYYYKGYYKKTGYGYAKKIETPAKDDKTETEGKDNE